MEKGKVPNDIHSHFFLSKEMFLFSFLPPPPQSCMQCHFSNLPNFFLVDESAYFTSKRRGGGGGGGQVSSFYDNSPPPTSSPPQFVVHKKTISAGTPVSILLSILFASRCIFARERGVCVCNCFTFFLFRCLSPDPPRQTGTCAQASV